MATIKFYATANLTVASNTGRYGFDARAPHLDRTGMPDSEGWFDHLDDAISWIVNEMAELASKEMLADGYSISRDQWGGTSVSYVDAQVTVEVEADDAYSETDPVFEASSLPKYVKNAMADLPRYGDLAQHIAYECGEGWKLVNVDDAEADYFTSVEALADDLNARGWQVIRTVDEDEGGATIHATYAE